MSVNPPAGVTNLLLNTMTSNKIVFLPAASTMSGHLYTVKDICGNAYASSIFLSTTGVDTIDANSTRTTMSTIFGSVTVASDGLTNWMVLQHKIFNFFFTPTQISNTLALWLDAADTGTLVGTTQVTSWRNKGTLGGTAANFTGSCTSGNTQNGLNFVRCPAGTEMRITLALNTQARSWFAVSRVNTTLSSGVYAGIINQTSGGQDSIVIGYVDATNNSIAIGPSGISINVAANVTASTFYSVFMTSIINSTSTGSNVLTVNGTSQTLTASQAAGSYSTSSLAYRIGTDVYNTSVDVMEVLFYYGDLTATQREQVEGYLAWKWRLNSSLPANHPYKTIRP